MNITSVTFLFPRVGVSGHIGKLAAVGCVVDVFWDGGGGGGH